MDPPDPDPDPQHWLMDIRLFSPKSLSLILSVYAVEDHLL
jgi:hypothetical protein